MIIIFSKLGKNCWDSEKNIYMIVMYKFDFKVDALNLIKIEWKEKNQRTHEQLCLIYQNPLVGVKIELRGSQPCYQLKGDTRSQIVLNKLCKRLIKCLFLCKKQPVSSLDGSVYHMTRNGIGHGKKHCPSSGY